MATEKEESDFKLTSEEVSSLQKALKQKEFRDILVEYAKEISDPVNKKKYEEEIAKLEKERGVDVKFIHPKAGHVLKTCLLPSKKKLFVNLATSDLIAKATPQNRRPGIDLRGQMWSIPYSLTPPRDDVDKANNRITIVDAIFNTETYKKALEEHMFNNLLEMTALDGVEKDLKLKIDRKHVKKLKQPYKGTPHPTVLRKQTEEKVPESIGPLKIPFPPLKEELERRKSNKTKPHKKPKNEPKGELDYQDYTNERTSNAIKRPKELVVTIELPQLRTAANLEVDIFEKTVVLDHQDPSYHLKLDLPYPVIVDDKSNAKFNKYNSTLVITLPVQPLPPPVVPSHGLSDPGVATDESTNEIAVCNGSVSTELEGGSAEIGEGTHDTKQEVKSDWSTQGTWVCPEFSYTQETDVVSYLLHVKCVNKSTLIQYFNENVFHITFKAVTTTETDDFSYSFYIQFTPNCTIDSDNCRVDVSDENVAIVVAKKSIGMWDSFKVGINSTQTEEKLFLTDENMKDVIHSVELSDPWKQRSSDNIDVSLSVTVSNDKEAIVSLSEDDSKPQMTTEEEQNGSLEDSRVHSDDQVDNCPQEVKNGSLVEENINGADGHNGEEATGSHNGSREQEMDQENVKKKDELNLTNTLMFDLD